MKIQRTFSNKEQKALRRKYDFEQGLGSVGVFEDEITKNTNAKSQANMFGFDKTNKIINDAEKRTKTTTPPKTIKIYGVEIPNSLKDKETIINVKNKKELDEIERARDIIREGRKRSRTEGRGYEYNTAVIDNSERAVLNRVITKGNGGTLKMDWQIADIMKLKEKLRKDQLSKEAKEKTKRLKVAKIKKAAPYIAGGVLGTGAVVAGVKAYKHHKDKKKGEK